MSSKIQVGSTVIAHGRQFEVLKDLAVGTWLCKELGGDGEMFALHERWMTNHGKAEEGSPVQDGVPEDDEVEEREADRRSETEEPDPAGEPSEEVST